MNDSMMTLHQYVVIYLDVGPMFFGMDRLVTTFKQEQNIQRVVFQEKQMGFPTGLTLKKIDALEDFNKTKHEGFTLPEHEHGT